MALVSLNLRNLLLITAIIGSFILLFVALGPQGISPAIGMSAVKAQNFKNLNLRASALPITSFKGGVSAPGVSIQTGNINVLVS